TSWDDDEPIELEPELVEDSDEGTANHDGASLFQNSHSEELGAQGSDADTYNAAPNEIALSLSGFGTPNPDATVEESVEFHRVEQENIIEEEISEAAIQFDSVVSEVSDSGNNEELLRQIEELTKERDELSAMLDGKASDGNAA